MNSLTRNPLPDRSRGLRSALSFLTLAVTIRPAWLFAVLMAAAHTARADVTTAWNREIANINATRPSVAPHVEARTYALVHRAMLDAIVLTRRSRLTANSDHAGIVAASNAAYHVLTDLLPDGRPGFDACHAAQIGNLPEGAAKAEGLKCGHEAATQILRSRAIDGWLGIETDDLPTSAGPSLSSTLPVAQPSSPWPRLEPFALKSVREVRAPAPYTVGAGGRVIVNDNLRRARIFDRINQSAGPEEIREVWPANVAMTWNRIARDLADRAQLDLTERARLFAALNIALADATIAAAHWRHVFGSWRVSDLPPSEEQQNGEDTPSAFFDTLQESMTAALAKIERAENSNTSQPILLAPVRDYPAAAAAVAGAAEAVLVSVLHGDKRVFSVAEPARSDRAPIVHSFASISAAARECAYAVSLDGRHTRESCVAGYELGLAVGERAARRISSK